MFLRIAAFLTLCVLAAGCASNGQSSGGLFATERQQINRDAVWLFWPTQMRIHPLTRIVEGESEGEEIIEMRLEFADAHDHMSKAIGFLRVELFDAANASQELNGWNIDLQNVALNAQRFDDVSRTYLFRLRMESQPMPEQPLLRAQFYSVNEVDLEAEHRVRR